MGYTFDGPNKLYPAMTDELLSGLAGSFYVYGVFKTAKSKRPIYVGKGSGRRAIEHLRLRRNSNSRLRHWLKKHGCARVVIRLLFEGDEEQCYRRERLLIMRYGRIEDGGCLFNFSEGGRGGAKGVASSRKGKTFKEIYGNRSEEVRARYSESSIKQLSAEKIADAKLAIRLLCEGLTPEEVSGKLGLAYKFVSCIRSGDSFEWLMTDQQRVILRTFHGLYSKVPFEKIIRVAVRIKAGEKPHHVAADESLGLNTVKRIGYPLREGGVGYYRTLFKHNREYRSAVGGDV